MKVLSLQVPAECDVANASRRVEKYHRVELADDASDADVRKALTRMLVDIRKGTSDTVVEVEKTMFRKGKSFAKATKSPA